MATIELGIGDIIPSFMKHTLGKRRRSLMTSDNHMNSCRAIHHGRVLIEVSTTFRKVRESLPKKQGCDGTRGMGKGLLGLNEQERVVHAEETAWIPL